MAARRRRTQRCLPAGFLNVYKPPGVTSHDVVDFLRLMTGDQRVGHCGTLDPRAEGVLPLAIGAATRLAEHLSASRKSYLARALLDRRTDTGDLDGQTIELFEGPKLETRDVQLSLGRFLGPITQRVPSYASVRIGGERLYEKARRGEAFERPSREVHIFELSLLSFEWPRLELHVVCSKGTYVRQLVEDLGASLGVGGALAGLVRTSVGALPVEESLPLGVLAGAWILDQLTLRLVPWEQAMPEVPVLVLTDRLSSVRLGQGAALPVQAFTGPTVRSGPVLVMDGSSVPLALCDADGTHVRPRKVLA
ncbi:MAG: tRNA pseudouridine(55) synthase TruB [Candidatus Riflebacteria bacterium]|nr:tRNA pseudouridine(55) synthase TruB [Candidatus Riflebacteria bacterium]